MSQKNYQLLLFLLVSSFLVLTFLVLQGKLLTLDNSINLLLPSPTGFFYYFSRVVAYLYIPLVTVIVILSVRFFKRKQFFEAKIGVLSLSGWVLAELILKPIFRIPCPPTYYTNVLSGQEFFKFPYLQKLALKETCFPSGHVAAYVVFCGYLAFLVGRYIVDKRLKRILLYTLSVIILIIGPTRLYLRVHWFSDVLVGYLLGFIVLVGLILVRSWSQTLKE